MTANRMVKPKSVPDAGVADFSISGWVDEPMKADLRIGIKVYRPVNKK